MNSAPPPPNLPDPDEPFGANEMRLNVRHWLVAGAILLLIALLTPPLWELIERFDTGPDYRIPYALSKDYWLYGRRLRQVADRSHVLLLGDSVVWGEYVRPDGTLSHFLNREAGAPDRFVNAGVNGLFPLALEGLLDCYGRALQGQRVILQCNVLWLTSPKADLSTDKEESFNHSRLVPQFSPRLPCYRADTHERLSALVERNVPFLAWASHLQNAYFDQKSLASWTLADDGGNPPRYPNLRKNPLAQITLAVPTAEKNDPRRGPISSRHKPWSNNTQGTTSFEWVPLGTSLQWRAFQRTVGLLRARGNDVLVILGPFNEHMLTEENRPVFRKLRDDLAAWLTQNQIPHLVPDTLPSDLYADASHPLTLGYELLATRVYNHETFRKWLGTK